MNNKLSIAVNTAHRNTGLEEGVGTVHSFLVNAYMQEGISVKEMAGMLLLPVPVTAALKNELKKQALLQMKNGIRLSAEGECFVRESLGFKSVDRDALLRVISDNGSDAFGNEIDILNDIYKKRPEADVTIDQALCTAETGINRALLMLRSGGLIGKRVLCAGDDDLTSIALLLILRRISKYDDGCITGMAEITVLDIDERVLRYIQDVSEKLNARVSCLRHDFREALPGGHVHSYDCVFSDPPYTLEGLRLFISRGASALKRESDLYFYLAFAHKSPLLQLAMQRLLLDSGFVISRIYERFNKYHGAQILGGVSDTLVLNTTDCTRETISGDYNGLLYTNELNRNIRVYMCKNCRSIYSVGYGGQYVTIERLKESGCGHCGADVFLLRKKEREQSNEHINQANT